MVMSYDRRTAAEPVPTGHSDPVEDVGDLEVAEWVVFVFAYDTYFRFLKEKTGLHDPMDPVLKRGLRLLQQANSQHGDAYHAFLTGHMPNETRKKMLAKAFRFATSRAGLPRQALQLRNVLSLGGTATIRKVFESARARREVNLVMQASTYDDGASAMGQIATVSIRNARVRAWIDLAAKVAGAGDVQNAVDAAATATLDDTHALTLDNAKRVAGPVLSEEAHVATKDHADRLTVIQKDAQEAAKRALDVSGEADAPPTKSEVIGIATAAAAASKAGAVPESLARLDPEQLDAALTDGRVVIMAGAGSGKTTTVTARAAYLVKDRKVNPARIFVVSFNRKAARELRERIGAQVGDDALKQMNVGTMHGMFRKFVVENGTPEEKAALTTWLMTTPSKKAGDQDQRSGRAPSPGAFGGYMARIWKECRDQDPPGRAKNVVQSWMMNDITPAQAKAMAGTEEEKDQAEWYAWLNGFKGIDKTWSPPCKDTSPKAMKQWGEFLAKWRDNGKARLGDFSDMIIMFRDVLKRDPIVRKRVQAMFDHILVDEAQDLNTVQHQIIAMMSEHIGDGSDGKSVWLVGDEVQSVNRFVGARPELLTQFHGKPGWKTKTIRTNYRCLPEIVDHANQLMTNHPRGVPMEAVPDASKPRGQSSIVVQEPPTHAAGALSVVSQIKQDVDAGAPLEDYAVLTRTNMEQNDFETACIIQGIPYARKGGTSFLRSPETVTVMSYFNLAAGQDFERMQKSLIEVLNKPNRFYLKAGESERIVNEVVEKRARQLGTSSKNVNPLDLFDRPGINAFMDAMDPARRWENWKVRATGEELENLGRALRGMRESVEVGKIYDRLTGENKPYTTQDLFGDILNVKGVPERRDAPAPTLRDVLMPVFGGHEEESDSPPDPDDDPSKKPIGNVVFLFQIAQPDPANLDTDPSDPKKFKARIDKLVAASKDLRIDLDQWDAEQQKLPPNERKAPPCVTLSTVHSVKGAQWNNTSVVMARGVFPYEPRPKPGEELLPPEAQERLAKERAEEFKTERQLAYVAMTRAAKNLTIVCPAKSAYGRDAGPSVFVSEAGLKKGQNVPGKNDPTPEPPDATTVLASFFESDTIDPRTPEDFPAVSAYDRRPS
jgi:superfamily I DNA/RNA helicase